MGIPLLKGGNRFRCHRCDVKPCTGVLERAVLFARFFVTSVTAPMSISVRMPAPEPVPGDVCMVLVMLVLVVGSGVGDDNGHGYGDSD
jgi:hypothetical protein